MIHLKHIGAAAFIVAKRGESEFIYEEINDALERMTGLRQADTVGRRVEDMVPADVAEAFKEQYSNCMGSRRTLEFERVLVLPIGEIATRTTLTPLIDDPEEPVHRLLGVSVNITDQYRLQEHLRTSNARLGIAMEAMGGAHWYFDVRKQCFELSEAFDQILGATTSRQMGIDEWLGHVHPEDRNDTCFADILAGRLEKGTAEFRVLAGNGDVRWLRCRRRAVTLDQTLDGIAGVVVDVTQEKRREAALREQAASDPLTGLANRRRFEEVFSVERERASQRRSSLSLLMMDVDHFKAFNDGYGHIAGDAVLKRIAKAASESVGDSGTVARYGGEEFIVLLPGLDPAAASQMAERIVRAVRNLSEPHKGSPVGIVTVSIGVAGHPRLTGNNGGDLIALADAALYRAKNDGRDCYRVMVAGYPRAVETDPTSSAA